jgi:hypothetical protein
MKRFCAVVVTAVAIISLSPGSALAATTTTAAPTNPTSICHKLHICP